ncbi:helix-turn-helix domain-containing protein [Priestia megaterium]|uniref:helix-turn-helix domain-containing protein n=1 Tax=Priestia megaterium TaxID=1404 RepID=UPI003458A526
MISFEPLKQTLKEKDMKISHLRSDRGGFISSATVAKINKNENIEISVLDDICRELDIPIEKVIKFVKE